MECFTSRCSLKTEKHHFIILCSCTQWLVNLTQFDWSTVGGVRIVHAEGCDQWVTVDQRLARWPLVSGHLDGQWSTRWPLLAGRRVTQTSGQQSDHCAALVLSQLVSGPPGDRCWPAGVTHSDQWSAEWLMCCPGTQPAGQWSSRWPVGQRRSVRSGRRRLSRPRCRSSCRPPGGRWRDSPDWSVSRERRRCWCRCRRRRRRRRRRWQRAWRCARRAAPTPPRRTPPAWGPSRPTPRPSPRPSPPVAALSQSRCSPPPPPLPSPPPGARSSPSPPCAAVLASDARRRPPWWASPAPPGGGGWYHRRGARRRAGAERWRARRGTGGGGRARGGGSRAGSWRTSSGSRAGAGGRARRGAAGGWTPCRSRRSGTASRRCALWCGPSACPAGWRPSYTLADRRTDRLVLPD